MKIGIIGSGNIGSALTRHLTRAGHQVTVANSRGPGALRELAAETGALAGTVEAALEGAEVVVLSIPQNAIPKLGAHVFARLPEGAIVVDTGNYYPSRDGRIEAIESGSPESAWVAEVIGRPVVKAFNNILAQSLVAKAAPAGSVDRLGVAVAGDAPASRATVCRLVDEIGFDPVDAGPLSGSWRQQPGSPAYCKDQGATAMKAALAEAEREQVPTYRANADETARPYFT